MLLKFSLHCLQQKGKKGCWLTTEAEVQMMSLGLWGTRHNKLGITVQTTSVQQNKAGFFSFRLRWIFPLWRNYTLMFLEKGVPLESLKSRNPALLPYMYDLFSRFSLKKGVPPEPLKSRKPALLQHITISFACSHLEKGYVPHDMQLKNPTLSPCIAIRAIDA